MRILFIDPPFHRFMKFHRVYYPMGLAYMAAVLRRNGHDVVVYDTEHSVGLETLSWKEAALRYLAYTHGLEQEDHPVWSEVSQFLSDFEPDLVGITMLSVKSKSACIVARLAKEIRPDSVVVVGGDHPTVLPNQALKDENIDYLVRGEGEGAIIDLVTALQHGNRSSPSSIQGVSFRRNGHVVHGRPRALIEDLDALPFPCLDALHDEKSYRPVDLAVVLGSRGCSHKCTFCGVSNVWTRKMRFRSPPHVIQEIHHLHQRTGATYFSFRDATFTLNRSWALEICRLLRERQLPITWECVTRADCLDDELLQALRAAGCTTIRLGVESGDKDILARMTKHVDLERVRQCCRMLNNLGFYWSAYFLFGTPWETRKTIEESIRFIDEIDPPFVTVARYTPLPGTAMYAELEKSGKISPDIDWSQEGNQRYRSSHLLQMEADEFETAMIHVAEYADNRNQQRSRALQMRDGRLK